ncbi:hypothetical protein D8B26_000625 [Coccidioides posadasii str. Silveira]|uniref:Uncharacterized protein n=1 Tax=Coccidioides posadasii RMSCC 3488 TaxID=454284 RepID=A0A0J6HXP7_COCPO|nr:hypothetical protein CPAG_00076 [Coccidioides posadasii RMSCC 3488]QVM05918.1 hypothetical protein D8B26_000625 [Coccidioides posadasii str. Silveira]
MKYLGLIIAALLPITPLAAPQRRCGPVEEFYNPRREDWIKYNTDGWFHQWIEEVWTNPNTSDQRNSLGLSATLGQWALGDDRWTCKDDGSTNNCDLNVCDNRVLNGKGASTRNAYYTLRAISNLHNYFLGVGQAFETSVVSAAFAKDSWASLFYDGDGGKDATYLKEILNVVATLFGVAGGLAALGTQATAATGAVAASLVAGSMTSTYHAVNPEDESFQISAELGEALGQLTLDWANSRIRGNNELMDGRTFGDMYLDTWLKDGFWVDFTGVDKATLSENTFTALKAIAINSIWRKQRVFIVGGGSCGDGEGVGEGTSEQFNGRYMLCEDGKAWYLYYWQENDLHTFWGWTAPPWGGDRLGAGAFEGITPQDVIRSSIKSHRAGGYDYSAETFSSRMTEAYKNGNNPFSEGPSMEGIWTIPVCDVSAAIENDYCPNKQYILQPFGSDKRQVWCCPICEGDMQKSLIFMDRAHLSDTDDPVYGCPCPVGKECGNAEKTWRALEGEKIPSDWQRDRPNGPKDV